MTHSELCPRRLTRLVDWSKWKNPLWRSSYHKIFTRIHPSTHTFANSDILESKNEKNPENAKKIEFVFHLVLLGIIIRKEAKKLLNLPTTNTQTFQLPQFRGSVLPLAVVDPTFSVCSRTEFVDFRIEFFGGGLESTSSVEWRPRGTSPPPSESSKWKDFKKKGLRIVPPNPPLLQV